MSECRDSAHTGKKKQQKGKKRNGKGMEKEEKKTVRLCVSASTEESEKRGQRDLLADCLPTAAPPQPTAVYK